MCEVPQAVSLRLQTESFSLPLRKPENDGQKVAFIMQANGEDPFNLTISVSMTRSEASSGAVIASNGSIRIDQRSFSAFGQHIEWTQLPPATWLADLDGSGRKFEYSLRHEFTVRLACGRSEQSCAADGDVITTVVKLAAITPVPGDLSANLRSEVRVLTLVQSSLSCVHTQAAARIEPDFVERLPIATLFRVQVSAKDVDDLPMNFTRAEINLRFGARSIPMSWSRGSSEYSADVPAETPGV